MQKPKSKICPNCNANLALEVSICPYCDNNFFNNNVENLYGKKGPFEDDTSYENYDDNLRSLSSDETISSLYPPPYTPKAIDTEEREEDDFNAMEQVKEDAKEMKDMKNSYLVPTILFFVGVNFFLFSLFLLLFSSGGFVYLKFTAKFWFLYSLVSLPLLYLGLKGFKNIDVE